MQAPETRFRRDGREYGNEVQEILRARDENQSVAACRVITCFAIREFEDLIRIVAGKIGIDLALIEKDGIMHCLYGLQRLGYKFELKCGTSLFKGFKFVRARRRWAHY